MIKDKAKSSSDPTRVLYLKENYICEKYLRINIITFMVFLKESMCQRYVLKTKGDIKESTNEHCLD